MKIGVNTLFFIPGEVGGTETYLRKVLEAMARNHSDCELVLFASRENDTTLRDFLAEFPQVSCVRLPFRATCRPLRIVVEQVLLPFFVWWAKVDVLWSPGYTAPCWSPCPQTVTIPDVQYKTHPEDMSWSERLVLDSLVRMGCRRCQSVLTISEFSRQEIVRFGFAPPDKVHAVHLGVDPRFGQVVSAADCPDPTTVTLCTEQPYLLCVAHTYPHKKVDLLIEAFGLIEDRLPHRLILVGKSRRGEPLVQRQLEKLKNRDRVVRLESLDSTSLRFCFQQADLFILPSAYEGFGLPVLEAMMAGVAVVTSKMASIPEIGQDAVVYCDPLTAENLAEVLMTTLSLEKESNQSKISRARKRAAGFTWEKTASETMILLQKAALLE